MLCGKGAPARGRFGGPSQTRGWPARGHRVCEGLWGAFNPTRKRTSVVVGGPAGGVEGGLVLVGWRRL